MRAARCALYSLVYLATSFGIQSKAFAEAETPSANFGDAPKFTISTMSQSPFKSNPILPPSSTLQGEVSVTEDFQNPLVVIDHLVDTAIARDREKELLDAKGRHHDNTMDKLWWRSKDMLQYITTYQGFESSSEAADVILEEKLKPKNKAAVEFLKQKKIDSAHFQITCAAMEVAMGLGMPDQAKRDRAVSAGLEEMTKLVGEEEANKSVKALTAWAKHLEATSPNFDREPFDVLSLKQKSSAILASSLKDDTVVKSIEVRLHKFNRHSNFSRATSKFVNTTLSIVSLTPSFVSPAAQAAQTVYVACTGGPEEKKLLKEVYLDKCFVSRFQRLDGETALAVNNFNTAVLTKNPVLFNFSQQIVQGLTGSAVATTILDNTDNKLEDIAGKKADGSSI